MYGRLPIAEVLAEVRKTGADDVDIWPEGHANHREQIEAMGRERFASMLRQHKVRVGILTHYDLSPFGLQAEMKVAKELGASMIICGSRGPAYLKGKVLKAAIAEFIEKMKPHVEVAEKLGITVGIENHSNSLVQSPDSIKWFAELSTSERLGIALAPYHLPQEPTLIAGLIKGLREHIVHFYAWQHGMGCHKKLPKEQELLQLPGRGTLDFTPVIKSLRRIDYRGWTEIFMHPVPRGIPIMPTATEVSQQISRARQYLDECVGSSAKESASRGSS
jgi:sugar phosphate isomerase/epimerase